MADRLPPDSALEPFYAADRDIPTVDPVAAARILARVEGAAMAASTAAVTATTVGVKLTVGIAIGCFVAGTVTGAAFMAPPSIASREPATRSEPDQRPIDARVARRSLQAPIADTTADPTVDVGEADVGESGELPRSGAPRARPRTDVREATGTGAPSHLAAERRLVEAARAALARGRSSDALQLLARHARRFSDGALAEDRDSLVVEALFGDERWSEVIAHGRAFDAQYAQSLYRGRVARFVREARERADDSAARDDRRGEPPTSVGQTAPNHEEQEEPRDANRATGH